MGSPARGERTTARGTRAGLAIVRLLVSKGFSEQEACELIFLLGEHLDERLDARSRGRWPAGDGGGT